MSDSAMIVRSLRDIPNDVGATRSNRNGEIGQGESRGVVIIFSINMNNYKKN